MKDTFYFQHDYSPRTDDKIVELIATYRMEGYGIYWSVVEMLHQEAQSRIDLTDDRIRRMSISLRTKADKLRKVLQDCINVFHLFVLEDGYLYSDRVMRNKEKRVEIAEVRREAGRRGGIRSQEVAKQNRAKLEQNEANPTKESKEIKETKEKKESIYIAGDASPYVYTSFEAFNDWVNTNAPAVATMKEPFTQEQYNAITQAITSQRTAELLIAMHNWVDLLKNNKSAYLTLTSWHKRQPKDPPNTPRQPPQDTGLPDARELLKMKNRQ